MNRSDAEVPRHVLVFVTYFESSNAMTEWIHNVSRIGTCLGSLSVRDETGQDLEPDLAFSRWTDITMQVREAEKTVYLIGNGASASMASHISADLAKNAHVHTEVFTDLSLITAMANDLGFDEVYAQPLRRRMTAGDMLVAISCSGQSPNILRAAQEALGLGGYLITLSAMSPDNTLRSLGTLNLYVSAKTYGMAETCHAAILHFWVDRMTRITVQAEKLSQDRLFDKWKETETQ